MFYEQTARDLFSYFTHDCEQVLDVRIKQYKIDEVIIYHFIKLFYYKPNFRVPSQNISQHSGLGFVRFPLTPSGVLAVKKSIHYLGNVSIEQVTFDCNMSVTLENILRERPELNMQWSPAGK
jgi:hypothetical protein